MIKQSLVYSCDVPWCKTPSNLSDEAVLNFNGPIRRPCAPSGWRYVEGFGLLCDKHGARFDKVVEKFFTEPGPK